MFMVLNRKDPKLTSEAGMRAMLRAVDDDENIREATLRLLQAHGFRAVAAGDAQGLQQKLAREGLEQPRLVITDLHLGADRADGLQGLQALRRQAGWRPSPGRGRSAAAPPRASAAGRSPRPLGLKTRSAGR